MRDPSSFRDPHGFVFRREGVVLRQVNEVHREHYDRLMDSGLYGSLVGKGLLIAHEEVDVEAAEEPGAYKVLRPEVVPFVSYPYEWGFAQLRDAALATLRIAGLALAHGMTLRDASAYNITFHRGRPTLIDTTSFGILPEEPWVGYRQFCEHFLAPLVLMSYRDVRLGGLLRADISGVPLDLATGLLPARVLAKPGITIHVRMHARSQRRHEADRLSQLDHATPTFSPRAFGALLESLTRTIRKLPGPRGSSDWRTYYDDASHYSTADAAEKRALVEAWIDEIRPSTVWDLGANTGRFARLASSRGIDTVAFELDPFCVDEMYRLASSEDDVHLLPLVQDLTNPSPGLGWAGRERGSVTERGRADLALALAVVHHLAIAGNVPLPRVVDRISDLADAAVIEWVPKSDPKVAQMLRSREDVFTSYSADVLESALEQRFMNVNAGPVSATGRRLYLAREPRR